MLVLMDDAGQPPEEPDNTWATPAYREQDTQPGGAPESSADARFNRGGETRRATQRQSEVVREIVCSRDTMNFHSCVNPSTGVGWDSRVEGEDYHSFSRSGRPQEPGHLIKSTFMGHPIDAFHPKDMFALVREAAERGRRMDRM